MLGAEIVVGYLAACVWRKARRVAGSMDEDVDQVLDAALERMHQAVLDKLGDDAAVRQLETEASVGDAAVSISPRTRQRVQLALDEAGEQDPEFAHQVDELLAAVRRADSGRSLISAVGGVVAQGDVTLTASHGIASGAIHGPAVVLNPPQPGPDLR